MIVELLMVPTTDGHPDIRDAASRFGLICRTAPITRIQVSECDNLIPLNGQPAQAGMLVVFSQERQSERFGLIIDLK